MQSHGFDRFGGHKRRQLRGFIAADIDNNFLAAACSSSPEHGTENTETPPVPRSTEGGPTPSDQPVNLLEDRERNQVLLDLDRLIDDWQQARAERRPMSYASIERLLARKIEAAIDWLVLLARDESNERGRLVASRALGFSPRKEARNALLDLLGTDDTVLIENALMGLTLHPDEDLPATMIAGHLSSYDYRVQRNAALALYRAILAGAPLEESVREGAVLRLRVLLMDRDHPILRGNVAAALGVLDTMESEEDLLNLLGDNEPYPRLKAIIALGRIGTRDSLMPMLQMLRVQDRNTRAMASRALAAITDRLGYALDRTVLGEDGAAWREAIQARMLEEEEG